MPQIVQLSDGTEIEFPDGMAPDAIQNVMREKYPALQGETKQTSFLGTLGREATMGVLPAVGADIGFTKAFALAAPTVPAIGPAGPIAAGFLGGMGGSALAEIGQEKALELVAPEFASNLQQLRQAGQQEHPIAAAAGRFLSPAAVFRFAPKMALQGIRALPKVFKGTADEAEKAAAAAAALQGGIGTAQGVVTPLLQGQAPTVGGIAESAAQALAYGGPRWHQTPTIPSTRLAEPKVLEQPKQAVEEPQSVIDAAVKPEAPALIQSQPPLPTAKPSDYGRERIDWILANVPFGKTARIASPDASHQIRLALDDIGVPVEDRLQMSEGKRPWLTREEYERKVDAVYTLDAEKAMEKIRSELRTVGLDPSQAKLPNREEFGTAREFYDAAASLDERMRSEGVSAVAQLVQEKQLPVPFTKENAPTTPTERPVERELTTPPIEQAIEQAKGEPTTQDLVNNIVSEVESVLSKNGIPLHKFKVFGSMRRGDATAKSDIDIAITVPPELRNQADTIVGNMAWQDAIKSKFGRFPDIHVKESTRKITPTTQEPTATPPSEAKATVISKWDELQSWADAKIKESRGRLTSGLDPELLAAYGIKGAAYIARGVKEFAQWSAEMLKEFGEDIKSDLPAIFARSNHYIEANRTARAAGAVGSKAITPTYVAGSVKPGETVLNFGAGKPDKQTGRYAHSDQVTSSGGIVDEYDMGMNQTGTSGKRYQTVFASNVLNVQADEAMLRSTLRDIRGRIQDGGRAVFNYPESPRKYVQEMSAERMAQIIQEEFGNEPVRVGGTKKAPLWEVKTKAQPQPEGPGALTAGTPPTGKAQIEQLEESFRNIESQRIPLSEKVKAAFNLRPYKEGIKDAVGRAVQGLKNTGDYLIKKWNGYNTLDDMLRAKGQLSAELEKRGWRVREFVKTVEKAIPNKERRAAIAKWVDAGGDPALLKQGELATKPEYKHLYQEAQNLTPDELVAAQNIRNYFEARLDEAIDAGVLEHGVTDYIHRMYERDPKAAKALTAYVQSGILQAKPALAKKRVFEFDWEAEKMGYKPVQDFLPRIAQYEASLSRAIAARQFIAKLMNMDAKDGRPIIDVKALGIPIEDAAGVRQATLIKPKATPGKMNHPGTTDYRGDYVNREYPALSKWKWVASDAEGKPILLKGDVAIHPDYVGRVDALLKPSGVRYGRYGRVGRAVLNIGSTFKQTMLDLSGFHQVQVTVHGLEHQVMPGTVIRDINFENPKVQGLLEGGVTLGGEYWTGNASEGLVGRSLSKHIPGLGPLMETYHSYLFQDYIPRLKMTMALHALERNRQRFPKMPEDELYHLTAKQANAAFGELNYTMLERSKTAQDVARIILLAPDFLEARGRFASQALTRHGTEQRMALFLGAITMWITARIMNKILDDQYHFEPENMFSVVHNNRAYGLRTVQGDILHLLEKPIQFWMNRLNPVYGRPVLELATGRDYFGRKRSYPEQLWDFVSNIVPISLRTNRERSIRESLINSFGGTAKRWMDTDDAFKLAQEWKQKNGIGEKGEFIYDADKDPLRPLKIALSFGDEGGTIKALQELFKNGYSEVKLNQYMNRYAHMAFTGSRSNDAKWMATLSADEKKTVEAARQHKLNMRKLYGEAMAKYRAAKAQK